MTPFVYNGHNGRVIFGHGTLSQLCQEMERLGVSRALLLSTPFQESQANDLANLVPGKCVGVYANATMHTPVHVTEQAMEVVRSTNADCVIALGGGSTTGLGKAIALRSDLPQIVIPTTYAGSEMTPILGETQDGQKRTQSSPKILPEVVIYDVDLTMTLPVGLSGTSGINAIAHAVEALYARDANPVVSMMALEAISALSDALPVVTQDPANKAARYKALYGAWLCGLCLGAVGMALHHKLCHTLGGSFDLPHAETHTVILPHALAYNAPAIPDVMAKLNIALGTDDAALALYELGRKVGAPNSLKDLGMPAEGIELAVGRALSNPYWNPRELEPEGIRQLIANAFYGNRPSGV